MTCSNDRAPVRRQAGMTRRSEQGRKSDTVMHPCDALTLIEFRLLAAALMEGTATDNDLRILDARVGTQCLALWANEQILMAKANESDPYIAGIIKNDRLTPGEMEVILNVGFRDYVTGCNQKAHAMRSIAALLYDVDRLLLFAGSLKDRQFPDWCRKDWADS